jgi:hypothetical protein
LIDVPRLVWALTIIGIVTLLLFDFSSAARR